MFGLMKCVRFTLKADILRGGSDHALDAELAVAGALEGLGFTTELIEVALDLGSIETLAFRPASPCLQSGRCD
jgi:hypothetical protein